MYNYGIVHWLSHVACGQTVLFPHSCLYMNCCSLCVNQEIIKVSLYPRVIEERRIDLVCSYKHFETDFTAVTRTDILCFRSSNPLVFHLQIDVALILSTNLTALSHRYSRPWLLFRNCGDTIGITTPKSLNSVSVNVGLIWG